MRRPSSPRTPTVRTAKDREEAALVMKAKGGDPVAFAELEKRAARFVGPWLARYLKAGAGRVAREDLDAEARAGLWEGIATFDASRGAALVHIAFRARFAAQAFLQREAKYRDLVVDAAFDDELLPDEEGDADWPTPSRRTTEVAASVDSDGDEDDEGKARATLLAVVERLPPERREFARAVLLDRQNGSRVVLADRFGMTLRQFKSASVALYAEVRQLARPGDGSALQRLAWLLADAPRPEDDRADVLALLRRPGAASAVAYLRSQLFGFTKEVARTRLAHVEEGRPAEPALALARRLGIPLRDVAVLESRAIRLMAARAREEGVFELFEDDDARDDAAPRRRAS